MVLDTYGDLRTYRPYVRDKNALMWSNRIPCGNRFSDHLLEDDGARQLSKWFVPSTTEYSGQKFRKQKILLIY